LTTALRYLLRYIPPAGITFSTDSTGEKAADLRERWSG